MEKEQAGNVLPSASSAASALPRACMRVRIRDVLVSRILDDSYPPGFRLKELSLAREFNVSQAPIREALRELETLGLVISETYRGTRVRKIDISELREAYELRSLIEARAAELAVPCSVELCDELAVYLERMRVSLDADDRQGHVDAALLFHRRLVEASGNRTFLATWDSLHWEVRARVSLRRAVEVGADLRPLLPLHAAALDRLRAADGPGAADSMRAIFAIFTVMFSTSDPAVP